MQETPQLSKSEQLKLLPDFDVEVGEPQEVGGLGKAYKIELFAVSQNGANGEKNLIGSTTIVLEKDKVIIGGAGVDFIAEKARGFHLGKRLWQEAIRVARAKFPQARIVVLETFLDTDIDFVTERITSYGMEGVRDYIEKHPESSMRSVQNEDARYTSKGEMTFQQRVEVPIDIFEKDLI